jgi:SAM-dependent methyltransferase
VSPVYASLDASATPVPSHVQLRYDHSQIVMRDPTNQRARDESKHIRSCIKNDKKARLLEEATHQRTQATFGQRKRLHMFDGGCGSGGIIYYAFEAGIHVLVGCDVSGNRVQEARHMYEKMSKDTRSDRSSLVRKRQRNGTADRSMCVGFQHADAFSDETHAHVSVMGPYDIISYFNTLHYATSSLDALRRQFAFWESHLTATGSVIIQTVDSDVLIRRLHQEWTRQHTTFSEQDRANFCAPVPLVLSNRFYRIEWPAHQSLEAIRTGLPYTFSFLASMDATTEYVMMAADLEQLAAEHGLVCTQDQNVLASSTASSASLATRDDEQVVELYRTYVLRRCSLPALLA